MLFSTEVKFESSLWMPKSLFATGASHLAEADNRRQCPCVDTVDGGAALMKPAAETETH